MIKKFKEGFSLAEALITLVIISLIMAATMPIVIKSQNSPSEAPWKYITQGDLSQNAAVYTVLGETSAAIFGDKRIPIDKSITTDKDVIFATKLNPKVSVVTRNRASGPVISRHLLDFYEKETNGSYTGIGKVSFDQFFNLALGQNALDAIKSDSLTTQKIKFDAGDETKWNEISKLASGAVDTTGTLGAANTAVGQYAMAGKYRYTKNDAATSVITGVGNTSVGTFSMRKITQGNLNTGVGIYSLQDVQGSSYNTAVGSYSLKQNSTGNQNTTLGTFTMEKNTTGSDNIAIGSMAIQEGNTGNKNIAIGTAALRKNTGSENIALGYNSQGLNTTGNYNVGLGSNTLSINTTGSSNTAIGFNALKSNTTGSYNIVVGPYAFQGNTTGNGNIVIGYNVGVANYSNKLFIGGYVNGGTTSYNSVDTLIYGDMKEKDLSLNTKSLRLGLESETGSSIYLKARSTEIGVDNNSTTIFKGQAYINAGGTNHKIATVTDVYKFMETMKVNGTTKVNWETTLVNTALSDARLKNIIGDNKSGLKEIMQIQVKNYTMKRDKKKEVLVGVIAQELQKVFPNSVIEGRDGYLRIKRDEIFYACVNAIKELNNMFKDIVAKVTGLEEKIRILEDRNKLNEDKIAALERQNKLFEERLAALENNAKKAAIKKAKETEKAIKTEVIEEVSASNNDEKEENK